jgi:hypothetical protein
MFVGSRARPVGKADRTYRHLWADCQDIVGTLTSHNPAGPHDLLRV